MFRLERIREPRLVAIGSRASCEKGTLSGYRIAAWANARLRVPNSRSPSTGRILSNPGRTRRTGMPGRIRSAHFHFTGVIS